MVLLGRDRTKRQLKHRRGVGREGVGPGECRISTPAETLTLEPTSGGQAVAVLAFLAERLGFLDGLVR
jgi:hypothetical protein